MKKLLILLIVFVFSTTNIIYCEHYLGMGVKGSSNLLHWQTTNVHYRVHINGAGDNGLNYSATSALIQNAYSVWENVPTSTISFTFDGSVNGSENGGDGINGHYWIYPPHSLFSTVFSDDPNTTYIEGSSAVTIYELNNNVFTDVDVLYNGNKEWRGDNYLTWWDEVESVAIHEIGHSPSIDHADNGMSPMPVMTYGANPSSDRQHLKTDDEKAVSFLYGGNLIENETLAGFYYFAWSLNIPAGITITISPGSELYFVPGANFSVNGTLNAIGNSSNRIAFTRTESSGTWGGIRFNSGSGGSVKYCNINYVSNFAGIYCNNSTPTIEDNILNNMVDNGIYLYNASPTIQRNIIQGSSSSSGYNGIRCEEASSPYLGRNTIRYFTTGVCAYRYGAPIFCQMPCSEGFNKILRTNTAVYGWYYSSPRVGENNYPWGYNYIDSTSNYNVQAAWYSNILAENNWWGTSTPPPSKFNSVSSSSIDYNPYLSAPPNLSIRNNDTFTSSSVPVSLKIVSGSIPWEAQSSSTLFDDEDLKSASKYEYDGNYEAASTIYEKVFKKELNTDKGKYALVKLGACYKKNGKSGVANYLSSISDSYKNQQKNDITVIASDLVNQELLSNKEYDKVASNILHVKNEMSMNTEVEKSSLYGLVSLYVNCMNDTKTATGYYEELRQKYPTDVLLTDCKILLGNCYNGSQDGKNPNKESQELTSNQLDVKIANYPNPFNPSTNISFSLPQRSNVKLVVYDALGREVTTLANNIYETGKYSLQFNGNNLASGMYFYTLTTSQGTITKKMILIK